MQRCGQKNAPTLPIPRGKPADVSFVISCPVGVQPTFHVILSARKAVGIDDTSRLTRDRPKGIILVRRTDCLTGVRQTNDTAQAVLVIVVGGSAPIHADPVIYIFTGISGGRC